MGSRRRTRDELREAMTCEANATRKLADEMARMFGGCDDPLYPMVLGQFRDWQDFVDRVARPLVESDGDDRESEQAALALYRQASPYFICVAMVMMANRIAEPGTRNSPPTRRPGG